MEEDNINTSQGENDDSQNEENEKNDNDENSNDSDDGNKYNDYSDGGIISTFCQLEGNDFFVEISEEFLENKFNLYGIPKHIKNFKYIKYIIFIIIYIYIYIYSYLLDLILENKDDSDIDNDNMEE
jgi:hypothetical protein